VNALLRLLIVADSILFQRSVICSTNYWLRLTLLRAASSYSLIASGLVLTHFALIYSLVLFIYSCFSYFSLFCFDKVSSHYFCFCFKANISSTLAWILNSSCCLSPFPSIYSQHLAKAAFSKSPTLVPNSSNHSLILFLLLALK